MSGSLVAVPEAVPVAVYADTLSGAWRRAGVRHGATGVRGRNPQRRVVDGRQRAPIAREQARSDVHEAGLDVEALGLGDEIALPRVRALAEEVHAGAHRRGSSMP